jgi:endonuclease/exonuclease/phosphatase (EEP) superfamily protein YafD
MPSSKNKFQTTLLTRLNKLPEIALSLFALAFLAGCCSKFGWLCNLPSHFVLQFAALFFLTTSLFLLKRKYAYSFISFALFVTSMSQLAPYLIQNSQANLSASANAITIKFLQLNVFKHNPDLPRLSSVIRNENADLLSMEEFNDRISEELKSNTRSQATTLSMHQPKVMHP